jgi:hypothetical protein
MANMRVNGKPTGPDAAMRRARDGELEVVERETYGA